MQHINIEAVETQAREWLAFSLTPGLDLDTADDYAIRAVDLFQFARDLRRWR